MRRCILLLPLLLLPALSPAGNSFELPLPTSQDFLPAGKPAASVENLSASSARLRIHLPPNTSVSAASLQVHTNTDPPVNLSCRLERPAADDSLTAGFSLLVEGDLLTAPTLILSYRRCAGTICFPPEEIDIPLPGRLPQNAPAPADSTIVEPELQLEAYVPGLESCTYVRTFAGATDPETFLAFLSGSRPEDPQASQTFIDRAFARGGIPVLFLALLVAGFLLNFTPCVLPLIPVNLALLGAGMTRPTGHRQNGFVRGFAFGLGITIVYGGLGLLSALTGQAFGHLHSSILFQASVAIVFLLLAAGMLDLIRIDFSVMGRSLRPRRPISSKVNGAPGFFQALAAGAVSALLSGACVAPVLVSALVLSADLVRRGQYAGAILPFLLGAGMALPWPFLAGGFAVLPKPGAWMERIRHLFAIVFILMAGFYAYQAYRLALSDDPTTGLHQQDPNAAVLLGKITQRNILVFYTADWCAACREMKKTTLRNPRVIQAMDEFILLTLDCTKIDAPDVKRNLELGHAIGLPAFAVFRPPAPADSGTTGENAVSPSQP
ncbi:MAG: cytochrome c biogenesis protein CcdA [Kiritimatiellia bacterium]